MFISFKKWASAVDLNASSGQGRNQSIVVQFTKAGKVLNLLLKASPTGENVKHKWSFSLQILINYAYFSLLVPSLNSSIIFYFSSAGNRLGISPLFSKLEISSTIPSLTIWVSENKNTVSFYSIPQFFISFYISSIQFR